MTLLRVSLVAALLALLGAWPAAAGVRVVARDEPLGAAKPTTVARAAPLRFDMVGIHWRGPGTVWFRTRARTRAWSSWQPARPEGEDTPDRGTREARAGGRWKLGNPYWTGPSKAIQYRLRATNDVRNLVYPFYVVPAEESG